MRWRGCVAYWWHTVNPIDNPDYDRAQLSKYSTECKMIMWDIQKAQSRTLHQLVLLSVCSPVTRRTAQRWPVLLLWVSLHNPFAYNGHPTSARIRACDVGQPKMYCHMNQMPAVPDLKPWPHAFISVHLCNMRVFAIKRLKSLNEATFSVSTCTVVGDSSSCLLLKMVYAPRSLQKNRPAPSHSHSVHLISLISFV